MSNCPWHYLAIAIVPQETELPLIGFSAYKIGILLKATRDARHSSEFPHSPMSFLYPKRISDLSDLWRSKFIFLNILASG
ncbi:hypothetical protein Nepgr_021513 [Nepenthes gracilis]|uniref:Uncharacterized protein n=1 Tax=Nepenthes gracilis TaxID=150966 RepID=A0AAD3SYW0_NEPGR|nr:hypothetical protein Nepgr_021513 [Nepenthes gracilis]